MANRDHCLEKLQEWMGSEGSRAEAELIYKYLKDHDMLIYDNNDIRLPEISDEEFIKIWASVDLHGYNKYEGYLPSRPPHGCTSDGRCYNCEKPIPESIKWEYFNDGLGDRRDATCPYCGHCMTQYRRDGGWH